MRLASFVVIAVLLAGCSGEKAASRPAEPAAAKAPAVKIAEFYATATRIGRGERSLLCYGVENAKALKLEPAAADVWPALSRCFEVRPAATTRYTLTATGADGQTVSRSATIEVGAPKPAGPHIIEVTVNKLEIAKGEPVVVCYTARNAASVTITPGKAGARTAERGCVTDNPAVTTTYQVTATGAGGQQDSERVTVKVR